MLKRFEFQGVTYTTEREVRKALFESQKVALGEAPTEGVEAFWLSYGVKYFEVDEPIETLKQQKHLVVKQLFLAWRNNKATLISSMGFKADSNERAMSDVSGLLIAHEDNQEASITFRDADNEFHSLTYAQVKTLQKEIIENGNHAYSQKWMFDAQVESATTKEEIDAINVQFEGKNFLEG